MEQSANRIYSSPVYAMPATQVLVVISCVGIMDFVKREFVPVTRPGGVRKSIFF